MGRPGVVAAVAALSAGSLLLWPGGGAAPPPIETVTPRQVPAGRITVHVSGAVVAPGLVSLPAGSRVADAVMAAGGAVPGAALVALNLAAPVSDGQHLVVPDGGSPSGGVAADGRVAINSADAAALEALPGVGPVLALRIVEHRERHGPFSTPEDLLDVPGIGETKLAGLRESVLVP